jgi:hypothetical protein
MVQIKQSGFYCFLLLIFVLASLNNVTGQVRLKEKTSFQISAPWRAEYDVRSDIVAIVYGLDSQLKILMESSWKIQMSGMNYPGPVYCSL